MKMSKKTQVIVVIISVVLLLSVCYVMWERNARENAAKANIEDAVARIAENYSIKVNDVFFDQRNLDWDTVYYDLSVDIEKVEEDDYEELYSLYQEIEELEEASLEKFVWYNEFLSKETEYVFKRDAGDDYALRIDGKTVWNTNDTYVSYTPSYTSCPNCGTDITTSRRDTYTYCKDCYDAMGFEEKTANGYTGTCYICGKTAHNKFQGSGYCDEHYEDAVLWAAGNAWED